MKICSVINCEVMHYAKGFCERHYNKNRLHGDPLGGYEKRHKDGEGTLSRGYRVHSLNGRLMLEHILIAEQVLGKPLPKYAVVHHVNGIRDDNRKSNLVICPNNAYHLLVHRRQRALDACGNANFVKCPYCKTYDDLANMIGKGRHWRHRTCRNEYRRHLYHQET